MPCWQRPQCSCLATSSLKTTVVVQVKRRKKRMRRSVLALCRTGKTIRGAV